MCDDGYFTPRVGSICVKCPDNTITSTDKTYCIPVKHFAALGDKNYPLVYHSAVFSTVLSENSTETPDTVNYRVCKT